MKGIDLEDLLFTVMYIENGDYNSYSFSKNDEFRGIEELKFELESHAETINGYYDVIADRRRDDVIAVQFRAMNPDAEEDIFYSEIESKGYIDDCYVEFKCGLLDSAITTIGEYLE